MNDNGREVFVPDFSLYSENRRKYPSPEELLKMAGEHVAFSPDGTRILAHGMDLMAVIEAMKAAGLDPHNAVWDHLDPLDVDSIL